MAAEQKQLTGGRTNYYLVRVDHPQREDQPPYQAECEDIIHALGMTFEEGCEFKAIWRTAAARKGNGKPGHEQIYDAQKRVHYATRSLKQARLAAAPNMVAMNDLVSGKAAMELITGAMENNPWIEWLGGPQPVDNVQVEYRLRRSQATFSSFANYLSWHWGPGELNPNDIVEYRVIR